MSFEQEIKDCVESGLPQAQQPKILKLDELETEHIDHIWRLKKARQTLVDRKERIEKMLALIQKRLASHRAALHELQS